jgi:hypothetical protein
MRDLKFRAWDKECKEITEVFKIQTVPRFIGYTFANGEVFENRFDLIQFTGLIDKNGRDIYEGDFLYFDVFDGLVTVTGTTQVYFADGCFRLNEHHPVADYIRNGTVEVVGNIYEGVNADE